MNERLANPEPPASATEDGRAGAPGRRRLRADPADPDAQDLVLVYAFRSGDQGALAELLERYQDRLFGVCIRMVNDPDLARDMTQDAMVKIIHGLPQFSGRSKLSTWMIRVTMNVCLTWRRKQRLRRHASLDAPSAGGGVSGPPDGVGGGPGAGSPLRSTLADGLEPEPVVRVEEDELRHRLRGAMAQIEPQQRAILLLRDVQGFDYREIAAILAIPEGTVKSRLFRARVALRESMERLEGSGRRG